MSSPFSYTKSYVLDKDYFTECFEESVTANRSIRAYYKSIGFFLIGTSLLLTGINAYASLFIVGLGAVEGLSVRFKKTWWLWRQMMSKAAGNEVQLVIDDQGIHSQSEYVNSHILWKDIIEHSCSNRGYLIKHSTGTNYLSKHTLDTGAIHFINGKLMIPINIRS